MKRYMAFLLCMLICAGCASSDERPMEIEMDLSKIHFDTSEKDVDLSYMMSKGQCYFYNGIYYILHWGDSWIYYYDEANESFGKLCGRPECEHKGNGCNAYVLGVGDLQVYEGQLYFMVGASVLTRMELDGMNRETVRVVNDLSGVNGSWVIHRDKIYTQVWKPVVENGVQYDDLYIYEFDLYSQEEGKQLFYQRYEDLFDVEWRFRGDYAYVIIEELPTDTEITRSIYLYDIKHGLFEKIIYRPNYEWSILDAYLQETKLILLETGLVQMRLIEQDLETGEEKELFRIDAEGFMGVFSRNMDKILEYEFESNPEGRRIRLLNMEGEVEKEWLAPVEITMYPLNSDDEGFIMYKNYHIGSNDEIYYNLWRFPYDGGEAQLLVDKCFYWKTGNEIAS